MDDIEIVERVPTIEEYSELRREVGWKSLGEEMTEKGLRNSIFSVCAIYKNKVIGCGRVIGDGAVYFYVQDIMVLPEFQRKGIGKSIMASIMQWLGKQVSDNSFVGLMATKGNSKFYEKYGFQERPPDRPGMFIIWENKSQT